MKKWIIVAALATAILASCTKNEVRVDAPDQAISFTAAVGSAGTKTIIEDNVFPTGEKFATFAYWLPEGQTWPADAASAKEYIPFGTDADSRTLVGYDPENKHWSTMTPYYWPATGTLTFFSFYHPDMDKVSFSKIDGLVLEGRDIFSDQGKDILIADEITTDRNGSNGGFTGVPTVFRHALSQVVDFYIKTEADYTHGHSEGNYAAGDISIRLDKISIDGVYVKASYKSGLEPSATNPGEWYEYQGGQNEPLVNYTWFEGDKNSPFYISQAMTHVPDDKIIASEGTDSNTITRGAVLVLPQQFKNDVYTANDDAAINVTYTLIYHFEDDSTVEDTKTVSTLLSVIHKPQGYAWQMNKKITYNLTIGLDQILWAPNVVSWDDNLVKEDHDIDVSPSV